MKFPQLRKQIIALANLPQCSSPIISAYFDLTNTLPSLEERFLIWKKQIRSTFEFEARKDFEKAAERIQRWLNKNAESAKGVALFAREGEIPFFLPIAFQIPFEEQCYVDNLPAIFPLVELKDRFNRFVVVLTTQEVARVLEMNLGETSLEMLAERPAVRERNGREWTREHYVNHCEDRNRKFIKEKVSVIEQLMAKRGHNALILAGEARYINRLHEALPGHLKSKVIDRIKTGVSDERIHDVLENAINSYINAEKEESMNTVKKLFATLRTSGLATVGVESTLAALRAGQAYQLVVSHSIDHQDREQLVRVASQHGISIETVKESPLLDAQEGTGAFLRYQTDPHIRSKFSTAA